MNKTAVEWLVTEINKLTGLTIQMDEPIIEKALEMEKIERLKHQLFIGKVTEILGFDRTLELLKECNEVFKSDNYE
jgi:hypothetical protein